MKVVAIVVSALAMVAGSAQAADGKAVYDKTCVVCHKDGVAGAPKFGDKAAWAPRIKTGEAALIASVIKGKNAMPPRAGNAALTDDEIKAAVQYMIKSNK